MTNTLQLHPNLAVHGAALVSYCNIGKVIGRYRLETLSSTLAESILSKYISPTIC